jgi:hypothetical protein
MRAFAGGILMLGGWPQYLSTVKVKHGCIHLHNRRGRSSSHLAKRRTFADA